jgi:chemotaxis signal transduction protein
VSDNNSAAALRRAFDDSFASPPASKQENLEGLLAIRIGADPYAIRLSEVSGLMADPRIVAVPSPMPQLLGIIGRRGVMAPVYDLGGMLNYSSLSSARWMVLVGATHPVGFAFETFEAHVQVPAVALESLDEAGPGEGPDRLDVQGMIQAAGAMRPVIAMASLMRRLRSDCS